MIKNPTSAEFLSSEKQSFCVSRIDERSMMALMQSNHNSPKGINNCTAKWQVNLPHVVGKKSKDLNLETIDAHTDSLGRVLTHP